MKHLALSHARQLAACFLACVMLACAAGSLAAQTPPLPGENTGAPADDAEAVVLAGMLTLVTVDDFVTGESLSELQLVLDDGTRLPLRVEGAALIDSALLSDAAGLAEEAGPVDDARASLAKLEGRAVFVETTASSLAAAGTPAAPGLEVRSIWRDETAPPAHIHSTAGAGSALTPGPAVTAAEDAGAVKTLRYLTLLCRFADGYPAPPPPALIATWFSPRSGSIADYYATASYGGLSLEFTTASQWRTMPMDFATVSHSSAALSGALSTACVSLFADQYDLADYDGVLFLANTQFGNQSFAFSMYQQQPDTSYRYWPSAFLSWFGGAKYGHTVITHEIGHMLGEWHTRADDGLEAEYSNQWDIMSGQPCGTPNDDFAVWATCSSHDFIAEHKLRQGWIAPSRIVTVTSGISTVVALDWLATAQGTPNPVVVVIPVADKIFYTVEVRRKEPASVDRTLPGTALLIHEIARNRQPATYMVHAGFLDEEASVGRSGGAGSSIYYNHDFGFSVEVIGETASGVRVRIRRDAGALTGAPARDLAVTVDTSVRGLATLAAEVRNTTPYTIETPRLVVHAGVWAAGGYLWPEPLQLSAISGADCSEEVEVVRCTLARLAPGATATVRMTMVAPESAQRLVRAYLFRQSSLDKAATDVTLANFRAWSNVRVAVTPAAAVYGNPSTFEVHIWNEGAMAKDVQLEVVIPEPFRMVAGSFATVERVFVGYSWSTWEWRTIRADLPQIWRHWSWRFRLSVEAEGAVPAPGMYLVRVRATQAAATPDWITGDNYGHHAVCVGACVTPTGNVRVYLPSIGR